MESILLDQERKAFTKKQRANRILDRIRNKPVFYERMGFQRFQAIGQQACSGRYVGALKFLNNLYYGDSRLTREFDLIMSRNPCQGCLIKYLADKK